MKRQIRPRPLAHHREAVAETDQPEDVQEQPEEPREVAGDLEAVDIADGGAVRRFTASMYQP